MQSADQVGEQARTNAEGLGDYPFAASWVASSYFASQSLAFPVCKMGTTTDLPGRVVRVTPDGLGSEPQPPVLGT